MRNQRKSRKLRGNTRRGTMRRGGARNTLPLNEGLAAALPTWDTFYISGHGNLENSMMIVPPNTYILNLATAGRPCMKIRWKINNWIYDYDDVIRGDRPVKEKLYKAIRDKTFFRDIAGGVESIYRPGTTALNEAEQYEAAASASQKTLAFYEPGDIMFDTRISFHNDLLPIMLLGAYRVPINPELRDAIFDVNKVVYKPGVNAYNVNISDVAPLPANNARGVATAAHDTMFNIPDNLIRDSMFPAGRPQRQLFHLSEVINTVNAANANGNKHLFMVTACRSGPDETQSRRMRRFSIAARGNRSRVGIAPEVILANAQAQWRTKLNADYLRYIKGQYEAKIAEKNQEKAAKRAETERRLQEVRQNKSIKGMKKLGKSMAINSESEGFLRTKDEEIAAIQPFIARIDRILRPPPATFKMEDILGVITEADRNKDTFNIVVQPELKALLEIA